jgi:hypothetical protein
MDRIRGWFAREREQDREEGLEEAEEVLRDPSLRDVGGALHEPGAQSGYSPGGIERERWE